MAAFLGATVAASLAYVFRGQLTRNERMLASLELYREYNSPDMVRARSEAWEYLINEYPKVQAPWHELWKGGSASTPAYGSLVQVAGFFYMVGVLAKENGIVKPLVGDLLGHDFRLWQNALESVYKITIERDEQTDLPVWMKIFGHDDWTWLVRAESRTANRATQMDGTTRCR